MLLAKQESLARERETVSQAIEEGKGRLRTIDAKLKRIPDVMAALESLDLDGILDVDECDRPSRRHGRGHRGRREVKMRPPDVKGEKGEGEESPTVDAPRRERKPKKDRVQESEGALVTELAEQVRDLGQDEAVIYIATKFDGILDTTLAAKVFLEAGLMRRVKNPSLTKCKRAVASVASRKVRDGTMVRVDDTTLFVSPHKPEKPPKAKASRRTHRSKPFHTSFEGR